jgi:hypothetical protein
MAVIQISKIQVRRGYQSDLPQLASGEFGWSVDERRLFIGNGTIDEGAPEIGNTEIVTTSRDILDLIKSYTFKGQESGYTSRTGATAITPVKRTFQNKLDDHVSVRDFGAVGDGSTDDTIALQRAIDQVFPQDYYLFTGTKRTLHIPAGVYLTQANITVPPYVTLTGDGAKKSIIRKIYGTDPVLQFKDSKGYFGAGLYTEAGELPHDIVIDNLSLQTTEETDVAVVNSATDVLFNNVEFKGNVQAPLNEGADIAAVRILGVEGYAKHVTFNQCLFSQSTYGINASYDVVSMVVNNSRFDTLYLGIVTSAEGTGPQGVKIVSSIFDNINQTAISAGDQSSVTSALNFFGSSVGYGNAVVLNTGAITSSVIAWANPNNYSIGDVFDRSDAYNDNNPIFEITSTSGPTKVQASASGSLKSYPGYTLSLDDNVSSPTDLDLEVQPGDTKIIDYTITRSTDSRVGTMRITQIGGVGVFEDDYTETANIGVQLDVTSTYSNIPINLNYVSTSTGTGAIFKYNVRTFV